MNIRRFSWVVFLLLQAAGASAYAEPGHFGNFFGIGKGHAQERKEAPIQRAERKADAVDERADRRQPAAGNGEQSAQKRSHLTPDERRALRRQINEAGRDIYTGR